MHRLLEEEEEKERLMTLIETGMCTQTRQKKATNRATCNKHDQSGFRLLSHRSRVFSYENINII